MTFAEALNAYMNACSITAKELSETSGVSGATISRFRNGKREPVADDGTIASLANAIKHFASKKGIRLDSVQVDGMVLGEDVAQVLTAMLKKQPYDPARMVTNLNIVMDALDINANDLSRYLSFDASYLSRIRSGKRQPASPLEFASGVAEFIALRYGKRDSTTIAALIGCSEETASNAEACKETVFEWLMSGESTQLQPTETVHNFLEKLDSFDLNEYIRAIHFDELKIPTAPFQLPKTKNYYDLKGFMEAEIDWMKTTVLSRSDENVIMYSDMPMEKMSEDHDFPKKWMAGLAMMLKKGLHLNIIHDVDRSFYEMILGLEGWIPLYMTGQVSPYFFRNMSDPVFNHFLRVSGAAALEGEAIRGFHENGRYHLSRSKDEIAYATKRGQDMLAKAQPLMSIYRKDSPERFRAVLRKALSKAKGEYHSMLTSPPIYTISDELLEQVLQKNNVSGEDAAFIMRYVREVREYMEDFLGKVSMHDEIPLISEEEFDNYPMSLSLDDIFFDEPVLYSYEDYVRHLELTGDFSRRHERYTCELTQRQPFRNIQIRIPNNKCVIVSKSNAPAIHFVVTHPKLRRAIENMVVPIRDE